MSIYCTSVYSMQRQEAETLHTQYTTCGRSYHSRIKLVCTNETYVQQYFISTEGALYINRGRHTITTSTKNTNITNLHLTYSQWQQECGYALHIISGLVWCICGCSPSPYIKGCHGTGMVHLWSSTIVLHIKCLGLVHLWSSMTNFWEV